ncbi:translocation/assembly module TamB domain-containing protein [Mariprofundus sp. KV]|uniref:translocation/assembly module TamB domain-containing protein n=1 Tax=Mariprofundus sp. KV TaxID=2608715 RepID=UPI0015A0A67B|nr:translocation/assembly module TamB domain-containing protein [Mariprofundus sp. KV]NWF35463.1 DUF490 domain-containing protein [Mariprofundus sp. KV]
MRRWFIAATAALLLLFTFTSTGLWYWLGGDEGRQWLAAEVAMLSDGTVEVHGLTGHPLSHLSAERVVIQSSGMQTLLSAVTMEWSPWRLLAGDLAIALLSVERVRLNQHESVSVEDDRSAALPPLSLRLNSLRIGELTIGSGGKSQRRAGDIRIDNLRLSGALAGQLQAMLPEGELTVELGGSPGRWLADARVESESFGSVAAELTGKRLQSGKLKLTSALNGNRGVLEANWQREKQALKAEGTVYLGSDIGGINGTWVMHAPHSLEQGELNVHATITAESMLNRTMALDITADWAKSGLQAALEERKQGFRLELNYAAQQLHGLMTLAGWNSPLKNAAGQLSGKIDGTWQAGNWRLKGDIDEGRLAGLVARMQLDGMGDGSNWSVSRADIQALGLTLTLNGKGDADRFSLTGRLQGAEISSALKFAGLGDGGGSLKGEVALQGGYGNPELTVQGEAKRVHLESVAIEAVKLSASHSSGDTSSHFRVSGISYSGRQEIDSVKLEARQKGDEVRLNWASQGRLQSSARFAGYYSGKDKIEGVLSELLVNYAGSSVLSAKRLPFGIDGKTLYLEKSTLRLLGGNGSAAFTMNSAQVSGQLDISAMKFSGNEDWMNGLPFQFAGLADLSLAVGGNPETPTAELAFTSRQLKLRHPMYEGVAGRALQLDDLQLNLDYRLQKLLWKLQAKAPAEGVLAGEGSTILLFSLTPWQLTLPDEQAGSSAALTVRLERLSDFQPLVPRIDPVEGRSDINVKWGMPLDLHSLSGAGSIHLDAVGIPEFGLDVSGALKASISKGKPLIDLHLKGGDGELNMKGAVDIDSRTLPDIRFNRFPLMQLPDQQLVVSGKITASERQKVSLIHGELLIDRMRLEIPDPVPGLTEDLLWEDEQQTDTAKKKVPLSKIDVDLNLNGDSEIYGRGMSLKPKGNLHLGGSLSQPRLTGVLEISSGKIEFRSVKLEIVPGSRVLFSGDPKRPTIQLRAARKVGDVTAGIMVEGAADQLNTRLYSEPAMSNAEIFSYIATGRPLASLGTDSASDMMTAAEFILGPGTMMQEVQGKVMQVTGLDLFEVGGNAEGGQIRAGRKLSEQMTLAVEQIVAKEPSTAVTLEYMLTRSVSIFARQTMNLAPRVGLRYSKEWFGSGTQKR